MGATAARDYMYGRLEELGRLILSERGARREEAKKERDFLAVQLEKAVRKGRGTVVLDPALEGAIRGQTRGMDRGVARADPPRTIFPKPPDKTRSGAGPEGRAENASPKSAGRPPYWGACEKLPFGELREFIDESLRESWGAKDRPRSKGQFLDLLEMLAREGGVGWQRGGEAPAKSLRDAGLAARRKRQALEAERKRLRTALNIASRTPRGTRAKGEATKKTKKLQRELEAVELRIAKTVGEGNESAARPRTEKERLQRVKATRWRIVARIFADIERAFSAGGPKGGLQAGARRLSVGARRLPWSVLPPGELSLKRVLEHYERLGRARPDVRYEPERIQKAYSLGPDGCYVGADEFDGYVVFTFPSTKKALLERPVYGNAIYVLGPDWKRLSRMSKRELLADHTLGVTKIVHKGDWFQRVKASLGIR